MRRILFLQPGPQTTRAVLCLWATLAALHPPGSAQCQAKPALSSDASIALHQALIDLTNPWTVMCVAAHPDDEDGTTLTVLRRKYGVHTVTVFSTYGEGGQNAVGPELYEELGIIRARETQAAAEIQGSEPYFLGLKDFGYSKSAEETFHVWGHEEALRRLVQKIRELQPDVIITNHDTTRGHGQHQATGRLVLEAFDAAADPKRFPEQLGWLRPWQIQRIFVRSFGGPNSQLTVPFVSIDPNEVDPVRAVSYAQQALLALQQHATQGPWPKSIEEWLKARHINSDRLPLLQYRLIRAANNVRPLPEKSSTFLEGLRLPEEISRRIEPPKIDRRPLSDFADEPDRVLEALRDARAHGWLSNPGSEEFALRFLLLELRREYALAAASGVTTDIVTREQAPAISEELRLLLVIRNGGSHQVEVMDATFRLGETNWTIPTSVLLEPRTSVTIPITANNVGPVMTSISYNGSDSPGTQPRRDRYQATLRVVLEPAQDLLRIPIETRVNVVPAVEITRVTPSPFVLAPATSDRPIKFGVRLVNHLPAAVTLSLSALLEHQGPCSMNLCPDERLATQPVILAAHETKETSITLPAKMDHLSGGGSALHAGSSKTPVVLYFQGQGQFNSKVLGGANRTRNISFASPSRMIVSYVDARVAPNLRVGYIRSFDYSLPSALLSLGVEARELTVADVQEGDLKAYDTIIVDNRGYEAHPELVAANSRLLQYAKDGGTLIVFYHKDNEWNPAPGGRPQLAPYPILLSDKRVTDEQATIRFLQPNHALLNHPNRIAEDDFRNWVQERGLYYPEKWSPEYTALFSTNDPGEAPLNGGLLVAQYGRGSYIYTSMVWYRQLRAGVPGAYRMLANMVSYSNRHGGVKSAH